MSITRQIAKLKPRVPWPDLCCRIAAPTGSQPRLSQLGEPRPMDIFRSDNQAAQCPQADAPGPF